MNIPLGQDPAAWLPPVPVCPSRVTPAAAAPGREVSHRVAAPRQPHRGRVQRKVGGGSASDMTSPASLRRHDPLNVGTRLVYLLHHPPPPQRRGHDRVPSSVTRDRAPKTSKRLTFAPAQLRPPTLGQLAGTPRSAASVDSDPRSPCRPHWPHAAASAANVATRPIPPPVIQHVHRPGLAHRHALHQSAARLCPPTRSSPRRRAPPPFRPSSIAYSSSH